jgi:hypothetical protein
LDASARANTATENGSFIALLQRNVRRPEL